MAKYRVGVAGMVHDHVWGELKHWQGEEEVEVVAAADPNTPLRERIAGECGVQQTYADWQEMLEKEELHLLQVTVENSAGAEIVEEAAKRGIHCISEKPMSATLEQADRMLRAANDNGIVLLINWPIAWSPAIQTAIARTVAGDIGQPYTVRTRMSHAGPRELGCSEYFCGWLYDAEKNGAGALMDYCCYGADIIRLVLGRPNAVQGVMGRLVKDDIPVDDNAIITTLHDNAFGLTEASWTQIPHIHDSWFHGSEGMLWTEHGKLYASKDPGGEKQELEPDAPAHPSTPAYLLHLLRTGEQPQGMCAPDISRDAQEILEAGLRSAQTGRRIELPLA